MFRFLWKPDLITAPALARPADGPEIVFHLGQRGMDRTGQKLGLYTEIFWSLKRQGHVVRAVRVSRESRIAARNDNRFHIFFHGRLEGARFLISRIPISRITITAIRADFVDFHRLWIRNSTAARSPPPMRMGFSRRSANAISGAKCPSFSNPPRARSSPRGRLRSFFRSSGISFCA